MLPTYEYEEIFMLKIFCIKFLLRLIFMGLRTCTWAFFSAQITRHRPISTCFIFVPTKFVFNENFFVYGIILKVNLTDLLAIVPETIQLHVIWKTF